METISARNIDAIIESLYDSFCGRSGHARDWDKLRALFLPGARIYRAEVAKAGCAQAGAGCIEDIIATMSGAFEDNCISAMELARHTEMSGRFAKVVSAYEVRYRPEDSKPFRRGKNRIQLYHDGRRWWIAGMLLCDCPCDKLPSEAQSTAAPKPEGSWWPPVRHPQVQSAAHCV